MTLFEAIILGIIQGATEFLPVSSSGHSILVPAVFGLTPPTLEAVVVAHVGTAVAVMLYFYQDLYQIAYATLTGLIKRDPLGTTEARLGWYIVVGSIPAAVVGLLFEDVFEEVFADPRWAAGFLIGTALILVVGEKLISGKKELSGMSWLDAILIGLFQMMALLPGISRSGSTIMGGLIRGLNRELAARYSFLLSVPVIVGAGLLKLVDLLQASDVDWAVLGTVFVVSGIVGFGCIHFLLTWLKTRNLYPFAIYCASFGALYLLFSFVG